MWTDKGEARERGYGCGQTKVEQEKESRDVDRTKRSNRKRVWMKTE